MPDLKPCPICGATEYDISVYCEGMAKQYLEPDGRISPIYFSDCDGWCVSCEECGYETNHFTKPEIAIEAWNRRAGEEDKHETD